MKTDEARGLYAQRQELSEPTFGILKDQLGARRFLLRGLENVRAEFAIIATAFNIRTLHKVWSKTKGESLSLLESKLSILLLIFNFAQKLNYSSMMMAS